MPTTLIIPDIHLRHRLVQKILDHEKCDKVVFLGDHFDEFNDNPAIARNSALWIKARMIKHPEDIWLWGNHDIAYGYPSRYTMCSGNTDIKGIVINEVLQPADWERFKFHTWVGSYLCTHAGLHSSHLVNITPENIKEHMEREETVAWRNLKSMSSHWMYRAGYARYGNAPFGGVTWLDFNQEFSTIDGVNQIFGHTDMCGYNPGKQKIQYGELHTDKSKNYCLDTHSHHYAIYYSDGDKLDIKFVPDEIKNWNKDEQKDRRDNSGTGREGDPRSAEVV